MVFQFVNSLNPLRWIRDHRNGRMERKLFELPESPLAQSNNGKPHRNMNTKRNDTATNNDMSSELFANFRLNLNGSGMENVVTEVFATSSDENIPIESQTSNDSTSNSPKRNTPPKTPIRRVSSKKFQKRRRSTSPGASSLFTRRGARKLPKLGVSAIKKSPQRSPKTKQRQRRVCNTNPNYRRRSESISSGCSSLASGCRSENETFMDYEMQMDEAMSAASEELSTQSAICDANSTVGEVFWHSPSAFSRVSNSAESCDGFTRSPTPYSASANSSFFSLSSEDSGVHSPSATCNPPANSSPRYQFDGSRRKSWVIPKPDIFEPVMEEIEPMEGIEEGNEKLTNAKVSAEDVEDEAESSSASEAQNSSQQTEGARRSARPRRPNTRFGAIVDDWMTRAKKKTIPLRRIVGDKSVKKSQMEHAKL